MTYVEKMALKVWDYHDMNGCEEMVNQIIADTKEACWQATVGRLLGIAATHTWFDLEGVNRDMKKAEVKEQEK